MESKKSNKTDGTSFLKLSDKQSKENLTENVQNLKLNHEEQIDGIIAKNKKFLAIIAHDIRSPMSLIVGLLGLLKDRVDTLERKEIEAELEIALDSATKSFTLLDNLLNWALTENSVKAFQQEYADIALIVQEEIENIKSFAIQKQIKIYANDMQSINVFIDVDMIKSVLRNLLHNAIKNTFIKGEIKITLKEQPNYIEVTVADNGIGIKEAFRKTIFPTKDKEIPLSVSNESRTGFGLILCKEIIDMHGGEIWVLSERGKGSEFKFTLPLRPL